MFGRVNTFCVGSTEWLSIYLSIYLANTKSASSWGSQSVKPAFTIWCAA